MANKKFLVNLDLNGNQLINASWEVLSTAPSSPFLGQSYFDSALNLSRTWNGSEWISQASASDLTQVKSDLGALTTTVAENKLTAADTSLVVTPGSTESETTTGTTVKLNVKAGSNDLKVDASGVYVTPYTADDVTITKTGNQFKVKDGVFDASGAADSALAEAKTYTDTAKSNLIGGTGDTSASNTIYGAKKTADEKAATALSSANAYTDTAKSELIGNASDDKEKNTIYGVKAYADSVAASASGDVVGDPDDNSSTFTVYGTRAYAKEQASAAQTAAEATAADDATSKANAAQAAAATDASNKADAAKEAAISAAATDATTKANKALDDAKSYADAQDVTNLATAKGYTDTEVAKAKAMLPTLVEGNGIVINTTVEESTGKKTYTISADSSVFQFRGSVTPQEGLTVQQVLDSQYGEGKKYAVKDLGDAWAYGSESTGHVIYAWDGDEWVLLGSAEGVSGVDTSVTSAGVRLTHNGGIVGVDTSALSDKLGEMEAATATVASDLATETSNRTSGDATTLSSAKTYADAITVNGKAQANQAITVLGSDVTVSGSDVRKVDVAIKEAQDAANAAQSTADTNKTTIDNYTVNSKKISTNPVLAGSDIKVTGYTKASSATDVTATDTVNQALGKVEKKADQGIADAAQALVDAKAYTDSSIQTAVGAGVHTYVTTVNSGNSSTILESTHNCGIDPIVQCYCGGSLVDVAISINSAGDVTVEWNGTLPSALKIKMVGTPE